MLYGYDLGVIAEAIASPSLVNTFNVDATKSGAVTSVFTGGAFFGATFAGPLGDYAGRKITILVGAVIFLLGGYVNEIPSFTLHKRKCANKRLVAFKLVQQALVTCMPGGRLLAWGEFVNISRPRNAFIEPRKLRFTLKFSVGILVMIVPLYQAELAHPDIRGRITSLQQLMLGVGSLVAAWIS